MGICGDINAGMVSLPQGHTLTDSTQVNNFSVSAKDSHQTVSSKELPRPPVKYSQL